MQARCFADIPPEIISEILLSAIDSFGDNIFLKWSFPLLFRGVSKRLYQITSNTRALWRYLYIRVPPYHYLSNHISHSGSLPLEADVRFNNGVVEKDELWRDMFDAIVPIFPRLVSLVFRSPTYNNQIEELLRHKMALLSSLEIEGPNGTWGDANRRPHHLPALRCLRSVGSFYLLSGESIPETLEELYLSSCPSITESWRFWSGLPPKLRILKMEDVRSFGIAPPLERKVHLPYLTELQLREYAIDDELSILQCLEAPRLQTIEVSSMFESFPSGWVLDFPALTHLDWQSRPRVPRLDNFLRRCSNLTTIHIKTKRRMWEDSAFVEALATDATLLPLLKDLMVFGISPSALKSMIQARPQLKRLEIHRSDLGVAYSKDRQADAERSITWLKSHVDLCINDTLDFIAL